MTTLHTATGAKAAAILGFGGYRPRRVVDNAEIMHHDRLHRRVDPDPFRDRGAALGVPRRDHPDDVARRPPARPWSAPASRPAQIDTVIVSTVTHLYQTPAVATTIASELGATGAAAFDISAACAGFLLRHGDGGLVHPQRARPSTC